LYRSNVYLFNSEIKRGQMDELEDLDNRVGDRLVRRSRMQYLAAGFVKFVTVVGGAVATVAQLIPGYSLAGIVGASMAALGAVVIVVLESDASSDLELARKALAKARQFDDEVGQYERREANLTRATELYSAMNLMRGVIERGISLPDFTAVKMAEQCLDLTKRELSIAFGFLREEHYTICVYMAEKDKESGKVVLRLVAQDRSVPCKISDARPWPEGIGVTGAAYATRAEIIIPDLLAPELGSAFALKGNMTAGDQQRYRSIVAAPISLNEKDPPWGVVTATSGRAGRFSTVRDGGVQAAEALRALAGMTALALACAKLRETAAEPAAS
jgi:GAF domain-containing protein